MPVFPVVGYCRTRRSPLRTFLYGAVAQLGERLAGSQEVRGSTPLGSTLKTSALRGFSSFWLQKRARHGISPARREP